MSKKDDEDREWWERWLDDSLEEISLDNFDWDEARKRSMKKQFQEALKARSEDSPKNLSMTLENLFRIVDGLQEQIILEKKALKKGKNKKYKKLRDKRHKAEREIKENGNMDHVEKLRRWKYGI